MSDQIRINVSYTEKLALHEAARNSGEDFQKWLRKAIFEAARRKLPKNSDFFEVLKQ